jgi:hypothetical protein
LKIEKGKEFKTLKLGNFLPNLEKVSITDLEGNQTDQIRGFGGEQVAS